MTAAGCQTYYCYEYPRTSAYGVRKQERNLAYVVVLKACVWHKYHSVEQPAMATS